MTEPQGYGATWYAATMVSAPERERLTFDLDVDVCVVGAGLAGLTTAREIARRGWSVVVLEAQRIASNASGNNHGFVLPGFAEDIETIIARVGLQHAKELWDLSTAGVEYVRLHATEAGMPGVDATPGWLGVAKTDRKERLLRRAALLHEALAAPVEVWPVERVRAVLKSSAYFDALHLPRAFHIHPLNYALGLAKVAEAAGVRIFEHTPALALDASGVRKRVSTPLARVRAGHVVLAGNTQLGELMPRLGQTVIPLSTYVATTGPLLAQIRDAVATEAAVSDSPWADSHYRIVGGDRLLWSGRVTTWSADPRRYVNALRAAIARVYPQLGDVPIEYVWSGTLGRAVHRMPQLGELQRGVWVASAFGRHGLNTTAMAGCLIARAMTEGDQTLRLFAPYELVWAGGVVGRAAAQVFYWGTRVRDRAQGALARRRELARRGRSAHGPAPARPPRAPAVARPPQPPPQLPLVQAGETPHVALADADMGAVPQMTAPAAKRPRRTRAAKAKPSPAGAPADDGAVGAPATPAGSATADTARHEQDQGPDDGESSGKRSARARV